jgi:Mce-associated membrane protein
MTTAPTIDAPESSAAADIAADPDRPKRDRRRVVIALLAGLGVFLTVAAGYFRWQDASARVAQEAAAQSVQTATDATIAMLSYRPDTVDSASAAAADGMTGAFRDEYTQLIKEVVAPGAKQQHISTVVTVPAASSVTASARHAVVLLFVDQATTIGHGPPTTTASSVRVTLDKVGGRWLVSQFDPV